MAAFFMEYSLLHLSLIFSYTYRTKKGQPSVVALFVISDVELFIHCSQELFVAPRSLHLLQQEVHSLIGVHIRDMVAQQPHLVLYIFVQQQIVAAGR
jgi:hypothetical protein